jgi:hypothetical protein
MGRGEVRLRSYTLIPQIVKTVYNCSSKDERERKAKVEKARYQKIKFASIIPLRLQKNECWSKDFARTINPFF